jgi:hypothetical protein
LQDRVARLGERDEHPVAGTATELPCIALELVGLLTGTRLDPDPDRVSFIHIDQRHREVHTPFGGGLLRAHPFSTPLLPLEANRLGHAGCDVIVCTRT